ncbi:MAG TPA: hypothetical protein VFV50_12665 [Bdellovibrionales bacterium]|nr:hypothetical protein [Bdellovibrionales bacterium]
MGRALIVLLFLVLGACSTISKTVENQKARHALAREMERIEIEGNPVDLTVALLDEALRQMSSDDATRAFARFTQFSLNSAPGYKVYVGERVYPKFRERFLGEGFMWRDQVVDLGVALNSSDIKVEAPIRIFVLKNAGRGRYVASVSEREGNQGNDIVKAQARVLSALAPASFQEAFARVKKQYPDFEF